MNVQRGICRWTCVSFFIFKNAFTIIKEKEGNGMMKRKKLVALIMTMVVAMAMITGCGAS